jgi:hypothetical protein
MNPWNGVIYGRCNNVILLLLQDGAPKIAKLKYVW